MSEAYRDVIIRIKAEADSSIERTMQSIGERADSAIRNIERGLSRTLTNIETAIRRLEMASAGIGSGGFAVPGGMGGPITAPPVLPPPFPGGRGGIPAPPVIVPPVRSPAPGSRGGGGGGQGGLFGMLGTGGIGMGSFIGVGGAMGAMRAFQFYQDAGHLEFDNFGVPTASPLAGLIGGGRTWGNELVGRSLLGNVNLEEAKLKTNRLDSHWRQIELQKVHADLQAAGDRGIGEIAGSQAYSRAMNSGTAAGQLEGIRGEMANAGSDEQRVQFRQTELQLTRQIAQEQVRSNQVALQGLQREKQALEEALALRQKAVGAAGESLGFSGTRNMQLTLGAAEKLASGQGNSLTDEEVQALQGIRGIGGSLPGLLEEEGNRRAAPVLGRIKELFGVEKELAGMQSKIGGLGQEITAKGELIVKIEQDQSTTEAAVRTAIDEIMARMAGTQKEQVRQMVKEAMDEAGKVGSGPMGAAARDAAVRTRMGPRH
jgi:hypothetical protein